MNFFFNVATQFFERYATGDNVNDFGVNLIAGGLGFLALNVVAIICARFADILHKIITKS